MPLGSFEVWPPLDLLTSRGGFRWQHVVLKVSLVSNVPGGEVSGHHKGGAVRSCGLSDAQLLGALPHHSCEMTWGGDGSVVESKEKREKNRHGSAIRSELRSPTERLSAQTVCFPLFHLMAKLLHMSQCESLWSDSLMHWFHLELWGQTSKWLLVLGSDTEGCYFPANDDHPNNHIERCPIWSGPGQTSIRARNSSVIGMINCEKIPFPCMFCTSRLMSIPVQLLL